MLRSLIFHAQLFVFRAKLLPGFDQRIQRAGQGNHRAELRKKSTEHGKPKRRTDNKIIFGGIFLMNLKKNQIL